MPYLVELEEDVARELMAQANACGLHPDMLANRIVRLMLNESGLKEQDSDSPKRMSESLRDPWYCFVKKDQVDVATPGIYCWRIDDLAIYVGYYTTISTATRAFESHLKRLLHDWSPGQSKPEDCRPIHFQLREAYLAGQKITLEIIENCPVDVIKQRRDTLSRSYLNSR